MQYQKESKNEKKSKKNACKANKDTRPIYIGHRSLPYLVHLPVYNVDKKCFSFSRSKIAYICLNILYIRDEQF